MDEDASIIGHTINDIRSISSAVKTSAASIEESVIQVIREVADQTNLPALPNR